MIAEVEGSEITIADIVSVIADMERAELTRLSEAIQSRHKRLDVLTSARLELGSRVRLTRIRPAYLKGLTGKVIDFKGVNIRVKFDQACYRGKFYGYTELTMPASCVELI